MTDAKWFGPRLRELRTAKGWSQKELADAAGIGQTTVAHIESGTNSPTWIVAVALFKALGVSCEEFLTPPADAPKKKPGRPPKSK